MPYQLNQRALIRIDSLDKQTRDLRIKFITEPDASRVVDFGVNEIGGLIAGVELARICLSDLARVQLVSPAVDPTDDEQNLDFPLVQVYTDQPLVACLASQYGGWQVKTDKFFAIGSGPMRAARGKEHVIEKYDLSETEKHVVGILETDRIPSLDVIRHIADECHVEPYDVTLCVAPTRSQAGGVQIVARSVEATMHKLMELDVDLTKIKSGFGTAPLPPVAPDDLTAIGRTNDSILYGGKVVLWAQMEDSEIQQLGPSIPSDSSSAFGKPFGEIFRDSGGDFYQLDPLLFSAAQVTIVSTLSGNTHDFGQTRYDILRQSFLNLVNQ